ncbi:hypothetical protein RvY_14694-2 [Ramazzottius varieornatus]|uniref:Uncharacterized protein n=1 Tax=Ramazzottius varieornatus TaxID=947166 RepID=A0A1D1VZF5_RAMVA|nr:hypothetical protein RvY_14694-2 [Ramazzottius varieornatus]
MAIIRFVKEVSEPFMRGRGDGGKEVTIAKICGRFGVRAEVVQIRHGSSHSDMHEARKVEEELVFVADWLKTKFWDDEERRINRSDNLLRSKESKRDADALCQQIRTDLLSLREIIQRDAKAKKNWRKANRKQLEAHLSAITDFLTQNSYQNLDVLTNVLAEEFLSPSEVSLDKLGSSEEIHALRDSLPPGLPSTSRDEWYFLVKHVLSFPGGANCLLSTLAQLMGDQNPERDHLTCAWILCILVEILPTNRKSSTRMWDPVNFVSVAKYIISRPSRFALPVLEKCVKISTKRRSRFVLP